MSKNTKRCQRGEKARKHSYQCISTVEKEYWNEYFSIKIFLITLAKRTCHGSSVWEWATVTNTHRKREEDHVLQVLSHYINNQCRDLTGEVMDLRPHRQHTRGAEVRGQLWLSVACVRLAGESEMTGGERERKRERDRYDCSRLTEENNRILLKDGHTHTHTHTHTHKGSCFTDRIRQMEDLKRAAFIYSQISEKVILHQLRQLDTHTCAHTALRWSWGKQLPKMTFQGFVFHIQNRKHSECVCVQEREIAADSWQHHTLWRSFAEGRSHIHRPKNLTHTHKHTPC